MREALHASIHGHCIVRHNHVGRIETENGQTVYWLLANEIRNLAIPQSLPSPPSCNAIGPWVHYQRDQDSLPALRTRIPSNKVAEVPRQVKYRVCRIMSLNKID